MASRSIPAPSHRFTPLHRCWPALFCLPLASGCVDGDPAEAASGRAVYNSFPDFREAPPIVLQSTVSVTRFNRDGSSITCSGTLVDRDRVTTAEHCVELEYVNQPQRFRVGFGLNGLRPEASRPATRVRIHTHSDIAVVHIGDVPPGAVPAPILPETARLVNQQRVVVAGYGDVGPPRTNGTLRWGKMTFNGWFAELQVGEVLYRSVLSFYSLADDLLQHPPGVYATTCPGDSGGPVYRWWNGRWGLSGIISGGPAPCTRFSAVQDAVTGELHDGLYSVASDPRPAPNRAWILETPRFCWLAHPGGSWLRATPAVSAQDALLPVATGTPVTVLDVAENGFYQVEVIDEHGIQHGIDAPVFLPQVHVQC